MLELRSGCTARQAMEALTSLAVSIDHIVSTLSTKPTSGLRLTSYFDWAADSASTLGHVLPSELAADLIYTRNYWMIRQSGMNPPRLEQFINSELADRRNSLAELRDDLSKELSRWERDSAQLIVPDTNLFLREGISLEKIDWDEVTDSSPDSVRIVVPIMVIYELDRLKRQGNSTTAKLARQAIRWLVATLPVNPNEKSKLISNARPTTWIEAYVQDGPSRPEDADGVIIRFTRQLAAISRLPTLLVTYDLGMRLRASALGVDSTKLSDE
jgi:hypothetical protein